MSRGGDADIDPSVLIAMGGELPQSPIRSAAAAPAAVALATLPPPPAPAAVADGGVAFDVASGVTASGGGGTSPEQLREPEPVYASGPAAAARSSAVPAVDVKLLPTAIHRSSSDDTELIRSISGLSQPTLIAGPASSGYDESSALPPSAGGRPGGVGGWSDGGYQSPTEFRATIITVYRVFHTYVLGYGSVLAFFICMLAGTIHGQHEWDLFQRMVGGMAIANLFGLITLLPPYFFRTFDTVAPNDVSYAALFTHMWRSPLTGHLKLLLDAAGSNTSTCVWDRSLGSFPGIGPWMARAMIACLCMMCFGVLNAPGHYYRDETVQVQAAHWFFVSALLVFGLYVRMALYHLSTNLTFSDSQRRMYQTAGMFGLQVAVTMTGIIIWMSGLDTSGQTGRRLRSIGWYFALIHSTIGFLHRFISLCLDCDHRDPTTGRATCDWLSSHETLVRGGFGLFDMYFILQIASIGPGYDSGMPAMLAPLLLSIAFLVLAVLQHKQLLSAAQTGASLIAFSWRSFQHNCLTPGPPPPPMTALSNV